MPTQSVLLVKIQSEGVSKASGTIVVSVGNKRESPGVIAVLLCKLLLPSTVAVLPICPCPYLKVFLRVRQSLRVRSWLHLVSLHHLRPTCRSCSWLVQHLSLIHFLPAAIEKSSSFAVAFQILEDSTMKGRPKLVDNRGCCFNIKRHRANVTDWQCPVRPEVPIAKLSQLLILSLWFLKLD